MQEIEKLRAELDQIHEELFALLRRRFSVAQKIWKLKVTAQLPFSDLEREKKIIHQFDAQLTETTERVAVQNILKTVLQETKKYLEAKFQ